MSHITICGTSPLSGEISVQRAKNSVLPILAATLLHRGSSRITHCPRLGDVEAAADILRHLGCKVHREGQDLLVDAASLTTQTIPPALMGRCRASILFLGALLARCGEASVGFPGGCPLGPRPIDLHLHALRTLGAECRQQDGMLHYRTTGLHGQEITLPFPSVGATENAMLAATAAEGITLISNAAREPEIVDLQDFLQKLGADVRGAGTSVICIRGGRSLHDAVHCCIADRIVAATYLCAAAACGGQITLRNTDYRHLCPILTALQQGGCTIRSTEDTVTLCRETPLRAAGTVRTAPYPAFPTDAQPLLMAAMLRAEGETTFIETMFTHRYGHVPPLRKMGADIRLAGCRATVRGTATLHGDIVHAPDLRGGAALMIAALAAEGTTEIRDIHHILRGYENPVETFGALGACIYEGNCKGGDTHGTTQPLQPQTAAGRLFPAV